MGALAVASRKDLEVLRQGALDLAGETAVAPKALAEALYFVKSAGFSASESLDVVDASAKAATAGLGETSVIADAVSSAIGSYGKDALSAAEATDTMVAAIAVGKMEANELAPVLGRITPISAQMGVEFDELNGYLAVMSRTGLDAAESVTSLRGIMTQLLSVSTSTFVAALRLYRTPSARKVSAAG